MLNDYYFIFIPLFRKNFSVDIKRHARYQEWCVTSHTCFHCKMPTCSLKSHTGWHYAAFVLFSVTTVQRWCRAWSLLQRYCTISVFTKKKNPCTVAPGLSSLLLEIILKICLCSFAFYSFASCFCMQILAGTGSRKFSQRGHLLC